LLGGKVADEDKETIESVKPVQVFPFTSKEELKVNKMTKFEGLDIFDR
jgi:hypothetical protein